MDPKKSQQKLTLARRVLRHAESSVSSSSKKPQRQIEGPKPQSPTMASVAEPSSKKPQRQIEGLKSRSQTIAPAAKPSSSRMVSQSSSTRTAKMNSSARAGPQPGAMAQTLSLVERFIGPQLESQKESEGALVKQPKDLHIGNAVQSKHISQSRRHSPSPSYSSTPTSSDTTSSRSRSRSPYRRRPGLEDSTDIHGHDTSQWGGAARQSVVRKGRRRLREYDDDVSDELTQAALGVCPHN
ncbi:hypothetical protein B0A48_10501 [Cryoendolithus antarcticus]|uniref:Uncharacterized protein n=1 Tax=Cryoendolithus antarcticus TaxID=1507870 RepID=A0A1V8SXS3_9PEZI|nr:hypothetical protein B0A48_10501 [Cryoendolithus antarcticus]